MAQTEGRVARLRALMEERGYDAVAIRCNADLRWLTGAERVLDDETAHVAFVTQDGLWLHTDSRYYHAFLDRLGDDSPWQVDMDRVSAERFVARLAAENRCRVVAVEDTASVGFVDGLEAGLLESSAACLLPRLHGDLQALRMVKDDEELALLRRAQEITDDAFEHICGFIKPGMTEQEVRAELENYMLSHGADAVSFGSIIATGANGANPHAQPGPTVIREGDLIVMDFGAGYCDYHADMTRTVAVGEPSEKQKAVYEVVRKAHEDAAAAVRPDVKGADVHAVAADVIGEAGYGDYFGHGLGHGVGIEIHESPSFSPHWGKPVPAGSVVTIEPGIYLPGEFGIRLEDTGVVTEEGYVPFTRLGHELRTVG